MATHNSAAIFASTPLLRSLPTTLCVNAVRTGEQLNYLDLANQVEQKAHQLSSICNIAQNRVVIAVDDPIACITTLFAVWATGLCAVMVNPKLSQDEIERVAQKTAARVWINDDGMTALLPQKDQPTAFEDAALILMTSGTTGDPKGVTLSLHSLEARLKLNLAEIGPTALRNTLCPLPLFFGHGLIGNCLTPLYAGKAVHLWPSPNMQDYAQFAAEIDARDITFLSSVPSMWRMILQLSKPPSKTMKRVHVGSAPLSLPLWEQIIDWVGTDNVFNTFGMTETANWISGGRKPDTKTPEGYVGAPWGGEFRVFRDGGLHQTGIGEVAISNPSMMLGLWDAPDQTAAVMKGGFMLTGDIGELASDQRLRLIGRTKHEINRGGIKVLAEEIDMLLERHPAVLEACGFGIPDEIAGELVAAVAKLRPGKNITAPDLIAWCRQNARTDAVPFKLAIVDEIPKNDRGKIARADIRAMMEKTWC